MSRPDQQDFAEAVIDSLKFAAGHECITGTIAVARMTRLAEMLVDTGGTLDFELSGVASFGGVHAGKSGLHLKVSGPLKLHCQRCLGEVVFECNIDNRLMLLPEADESVWPEDELESDEFDAIPAVRELSVMALLEEEVLLALPLVPRHVECVSPDARRDQEGAGKKSVSSPFAALAGLKKH